MLQLLLIKLKASLIEHLKEENDLSYKNLTKLHLLKLINISLKPLNNNNLLKDKVMDISSKF